MKSAIISVGTELLLGNIADTNAQYLSRELNELGIDVLYHYAVGDNSNRLKHIAELALNDCELVVLTGGLGPTEDDLTKETICELLGEELILDEDVLNEMENYFKTIDMEYTSNNTKQAYVPKDAVIFSNNAGTAPGFAIEKENKTVICMPGVPREMKTVFKNGVRPFLLNKSRAHIVSRSVMIFGIGESLVETKLLDLIDNQTDPTIAPYAKEGIVEVRVTSKRIDRKEAESAVNSMVEDICNIIGSNVYSIEGRELYEELGSKLMARNLSISVSEIPTAGLFSALLVNNAGISRVFDYSLVPYRDKFLQSTLDIQEDIYSIYTHHSPDIAEEMVKSLSEKSGSDICAAITGLAGPVGYGDISKGSFNISVTYDGKLYTKSFYHNGRTRQLNRMFMANTMFFMINCILDDTEIPKIY